jgi:hypothetical protein
MKSGYIRMVRKFCFLLFCWLMAPLLAFGEEEQEPVSDELRLMVGKGGQSDVTVTVYNGNFALIHEEREVVFPKGKFDVEFQGVPSQIEPSSVLVGSSKGKDSLQVIEQGYRYDLLNKKALLERFVGRKLKFSRSVLVEGEFEKVLREGMLLSINPEVVQFGDEIEIEPEGIISLPYIPDELKTTPTLLWSIENKVRGKQALRVSYMTGGMSWSADYLLVLNKDESEADLSTWVTVDNHSGAGFENASLKLVAGDVQKIQNRVSPRRMQRESMALSAEADSSSREQSFFEYHLYDFPDRISLGVNDVKQIKLFEVENIKVKKSYLFENEAFQHQAQGQQKLNANVVLEFSNSRKNHLSVPLPSGKVRVNKADRDGMLQFIGEDAIAHTPLNSEVQLKVGRAFDVTALRSQTAYRRLGDRIVEVSYSVKLKNNKKEAIDVTLSEKLRGDWSITQQTHEGERKDSMTQVYRLKLQKGDEQTVSYTARFNH